MSAVLGAGCQIDDADLEAGALVTFSLTPAATTTDRFTMGYSGSVEAAFKSERPATLVVKVEGQPVAQQAIDLSTSLTQPIDLTVPLAVEGPNAVSAELTYQEATLSEDSTITVSMVAPTITIPTFTQTYTPHVGLDATGTVQVAATSGYKVDTVATSIDAGPWVPAAPDGSGGWSVVLKDPDIGAVDVAVRADVSIDGHTKATIAHATMPVSARFDCATAASSMLPSTTLLSTGQNSGTFVENRIMVGYFGQPGRGHDVSFVLTGNASDFSGNPVVNVVSQTIDYGTTEIHAGFATGAMRCADTGGASCDSAYDMTAMVDGVVLCATTSRTFGIVRRLF